MYHMNVYNVYSCKTATEAVKKTLMLPLLHTSKEGFYKKLEESQEYTGSVVVAILKWMNSLTSFYFLIKSKICFMERY